jgi:thioredoxin-like negative regulator of GroEL
MRLVKSMADFCYGHIGGGTAEQIKCGFTQGGAVLKFSARWCGPCRAIQERFREMAEGSAVPCYLVDLDEDEHGLAQSFGITKLPTFLRLQDGHAVGKVEGADLDLVADLLTSSFLSQEP